MDNLTHSLFGALVAEATRTSLVRRGHTPDKSFRRLALVTSVLANNLPDVDVAYAGLTAGRLGYLLHHRGHTHTLLGALCLGALWCGLGVAWAAFRRTRVHQGDRFALAALALAGPLLHVLLDSANSYGVHPFWPLDNHWYYGDAVSIVEPLFWAVSIPSLALLSETRSTRVLLLVLFGVGMALSASRISSVVNVALACGLLACTAVFCIRVRADRRAWMGLGGWALIAALFTLEGTRVRSRALVLSQAASPSTQVLDVVATPQAADPFCWALLIVGTEAGRYVVRRGVASVSPWPWQCTPFDDSPSTAPLRSIAITDQGVRLSREYIAPIEELRELAHASCRVAAFLRFARVPFWTEEDGTSIVGDLRFDRGRARNFTKFSVPRSDVECPRHVPPWDPPRGDLMK